MDFEPGDAEEVNWAATTTTREEAMPTRINKLDREKFAKARARKRAIADRITTLPPEERAAYIPCDGTPPSEFEVQAFIYEQLKQIGYTVRGEVKTKCGTCIFDIVVYADRRPVRVIEVKKSKKFGSLSRQGKRHFSRLRAEQVRRYESFGVPVDLVCTLHDAREYIAAVRSNGGFAPLPPTA